jgi:hypothetical protein
MSRSIVTLSPGDFLACAEIVAKSPNQIGFAVLPRRWAVERFLERS